jgi:peptidylprolyl isomerase
MFPIRRVYFFALAPALTWALASPLALPAQTTATTHTATPARRHVPPAVPALPKNIPPVKAPMKVQYVMRYQDIVVGTGELAAPGEFYKVNYTGWLASDGTKFDSSYDRGQPIEFPQGAKRVIIGWDQGFEGMRVGGKRRLFIPYQLAYGDKGREPIPPKADLIFDIELVGVRDPNAPAPVAPPAQ